MGVSPRMPWRPATTRLPCRVKKAKGILQWVRRPGRSRQESGRRTTPVRDSSTTRQGRMVVTTTLALRGYGDTNRQTTGLVVDDSTRWAKLVRK